MEKNGQHKYVLPAIEINLLSFEQRIEFEKIYAQNLASGLSLIDSFANTSIKVIMMLNGAACSAIVAFLSYLSQSHYNSMTDGADKRADNIRFWAIVFAIIGVGLFVFSSIVVGATIRDY